MSRLTLKFLTLIWSDLSDAEVKLVLSLGPRVLPFESALYPSSPIATLEFYDVVSTTL